MLSALALAPMYAPQDGRDGYKECLYRLTQSPCESTP